MVEARFSTQHRVYNLAEPDPVSGSLRHIVEVLCPVTQKIDVDKYLLKARFS
jgi:hypothetical protein